MTTLKHQAPAKKIHSFHPPQRTLMGPGPTEIHPRVLTTMSQPAISNRPRAAETIAQMPRKRLPSVNALGTMMMPR